MKKALWVFSHGPIIKDKGLYGIKELDKYISEGWKLIHISSSYLGDKNSSAAYVLLEK